MQKRSHYTGAIERQSIRSISPFPVRLNPEIRQQLENAAKSAGRSLQAEIAERLENSLTLTG